METWKPAPGYETDYEISSHRRVRSQCRGSFAIINAACANSLSGGTDMTKKEKYRADQPFHAVCYSKLRHIDEFAGILAENDDRYTVRENVVYEKIPPDGIRIDTDSIPDYVRDDFAAATLDFVRRMMQDPGTREKVKAKIRA